MISQGASATSPAPEPVRVGAPASVAVVGAGRMGSGIAHAFLMAGARVLISDVDDDGARRGLAAVRRSVSRAFERGRVDGSADEVLGRLSRGAVHDGLSEMDLIVEAVPEIFSLKEEVLASLASRAAPSAVIATNTSSISVTELAERVVHPERFIGMHFFNPVPVSKLVEIVRGDKTSPEVVDRATQWSSAIGKESIVVRDSPGFATSRLGLVIGLEAIRMLEDGVATAEDIDRAMTLGYGFPVGPLKLTDIVGLDVRLEIATYLESTIGPRFTPPELLRQKVEAGELGRKSGEGFYDWPAGE